MPKDLILEIGTEEIPAGFISKAFVSMKKDLEEALHENRLNLRNIRSFGTPRRLAVIVEGLDERQKDTVTEISGPPKEKAFDRDGRPTKAAEGFARSQGVPLKEVGVLETKKGEYLFVRKKLKGRETGDILKEIIPSIITRVPFPKTMRWGGGDLTFARPIRWILSLYGGETVSFVVGDVKSGSHTRGHRFLKPKPFKIDSVSSYLKKLKSSYVILDPKERVMMIRDGIEKAASKIKGQCIEDISLLEEVANLVEFPVVLLGEFDKAFLELPRDVIINAMREHQRYFSVIDKKGRLMPYFITAVNMKTKDPGVIIKGNERVLKARLNDARFYFERDVSVSLIDRVEALKGVVYQERLGTSYEKVERFTRLALYIGSRIGFCEEMNSAEKPGDFLTENFDPGSYRSFSPDPGFLSKAVIGRAAMLCKADLVSDMVREFPKLQGIMGSIYAERSEEAPEVSVAIYEHYLPISAGGKLPASLHGAIISIADKLDTICGCFGLGLLPTGAADPYALRRHALGIIAIMLDKEFRVPLDDIVNESLVLLKKRLTRPLADSERDVLDFFKERLKNMLLSRGYSFDIIDAALSAPWYDIVDVVSRVKALGTFKMHPDCERLVTAFKRVSNILKGYDFKGERPDISLFQEEYEEELNRVADTIAPVIDKHWQDGNYEKVFTTLASIKDKIDVFFDKVMVMVEDEGTRRNRLILLSSIQRLYSRIADLSKLAM
jgi:glycyl-tRNA synthetase beta chain